MELEKYRETLLEKGIESEKVDEIIEEMRKSEEKEREIADNALKVSDVTVILDKELDEDFNDAKVRRLINKGELPTVKAPGDAKRLGYRIDKVDLDAFIKERQMTKEDWKAEALRYKKIADDLVFNQIDFNPIYVKIKDDHKTFKLTSGTMTGIIDEDTGLMNTIRTDKGETFYRWENEEFFAEIEEKMKK